MHPNGQLPAYEWSFGDVNPPVHAWAALRVFAIDGGHGPRVPRAGLPQAAHQLHLVGEPQGHRREQRLRGRLPRPRQHRPLRPLDAPPGAGRLEQSDATAWMAMYCLNMLELALELAHHDHTYEDVATKFFEHFTLIALAMEDQGLWDEEDGFYYDVLRTAGRRRMPLRARSAVGLIPLLARHRPRRRDRRRAARLRVADATGSCDNRPRAAAVVSHIAVPGMQRAPAALDRRAPTGSAASSAVMLDESEFLSPHGLRALQPAPPRAPAGLHTVTARPSPSTTSPGSRPPASSAGTPTGAGRCGSRSTTSSSAR